MREMTLVHAVHLSEVGHVGEEDVHFDDPAQVRAGVTQDGRDVGDAYFGLLGDAALDERARLVGWDLPGHEDLASRFDGLRLCG